MKTRDEILKKMAECDLYRNKEGGIGGALANCKYHTLQWVLQDSPVTAEVSSHGENKQ
jgi:hypothetical protein